MIKGIESVTLFSENAKKLADFYSKKVGLKVSMEAEMGDKGEKLFGFEFASSSGFYVVDHSRVRGKNKNPERMIVNFEVDDIKKEVKKLYKAKVKKIVLSSSPKILNQYFNSGLEIHLQRIMSLWGFMDNTLRLLFVKY